MADDNTPTSAAGAGTLTDGEKYRENVSRMAVEERAGLLLRLIGLVPMDVQQQAEAMATAMKLERAIVRETDTLESSWRAESQAAYRAGCADGHNTAAATEAMPVDDAFKEGNEVREKLTRH